MVSCDALDVHVSYEGVCFGHTMSKMWQYSTTPKKVLLGFLMMLFMLQFYFVRSALLTLTREHMWFLPFYVGRLMLSLRFYM